MEVYINYLGILIAAAAIMGVGYVWYGPLFGKRWMAMKGYTEERMKSMKMSPRKSMALASLSALVQAFVLALLINILPPNGAPGAFMLTLLLWTGFIATTHSHRVLFEEENPKLYLFNMAHYFVALLVASLVLVLF